MESIKVRIQSLQDAMNGEPAIEGMTAEKCYQTRDMTIAILEGGMQSGATSLMVALKFDDGHRGSGHYIAEMSGKHLEALYRAYQGAEERFREEKK